jgi:hypothetical protein
MTILDLFRKVFGCYHDNSMDIQEPEIPESHVLDMSDVNDLCHQIIDKLENERKTAIGNIVSAVIAHKEKGFISYTEEAMDQVTGGKYKFIKYRK